MNSTMTREDVKQKIKDKGLKYYWIAKQLGISKYAFSQYINSKKKLNPAQEERLHAILKMDYVH